MFISEDGFIRSRITTEGVVESKPLEAPPAIEPALSVSPSPPPGSAPLSVLGLSLRPHNALMRADITDIGQLAAMSHEQLRDVRSVGEKGLTEIEEKLKAYLAEHPVLDEVEEESTEPETQAAESLPPQLPSQPPNPIPLGILGLSGRPHFALMQAGITTIGQLAAMSREQIREVRNVSEKGLTEIEEKLAVYMAEHPLPDVSQHQGREMPELTSENVPPHVSKKTSIAVLKLSADIRARLKLVGVTTIEDLARMSPEHILDVPYIDEKSLTEIESALADYLGEHFPSGSPFKLEKPSFANAPLGTLGLSVRSHNALMRTGIRTVDKLVGMSDKDLLNVHNIGVKSLADIREKLAAYLAEHPLPDEAEEGTPRPEAQVAEPIPPQLFTPPPDPTPLGALELSIRPYNALRRGGITTIGQLATMSREQIREVRNVGERALAEIEEKLVAYLTVHPLPTKPAPSMEKPKSSPPPPPLADPKVLNSAREKGIPLDGISVKRLALSESFQILLHRENIETISELALQPRKKWRRRVTVVQHLNRYLAWLIEQDETIWANEVTGQDISPLHWSELTETSLENLAGKWLSVLDSRDNQVVRWRYGLEGEELTLEEVGERLNITRERVRQIQNRALRILGRPQPYAVIRPFSTLLVYLLEQVGGLINDTQVEAALRQELVIGAVDPVGVARLVFQISDNVKWLHTERAWGLKSAPLGELGDVHKRLTRMLDKLHVPLPVDEVITRFKATRFYRNRQETLKDGFVLACLRVHPDISISGDKQCALKRWERHRTDELILALREIGEPAHYTIIAEQADALLPAELQTTPRNIYDELNRRTDLFVRVGRGIFGLKEWGLPDDGSLANAAHRVLTEAGRPLHIEAITDRVLGAWRVERSSVHAAVVDDERFYHAAPATFGLMEWEIERLEETQPVLNVCPMPLPDRRGERNTFFESVLVARDVLRKRPTTVAFLRAMLKWVGTNLDKSERYLQNVLNVYYVVGLLPYTVYRRAADALLRSTLPETDDLQALRRFCFDCMMERLARMPEFVALLVSWQPCTRAQLRDWFYEPGAPLDDVKNRVRLLFNLGMLSIEKRGQYRLTPLGMQVTHELEASGQLKHRATRNSCERVSDSMPARDVEFDVIDSELSLGI